MSWRKKRAVMHSYDVTAQMYEERYAQEQAAKYQKALGSVKLTGEGAVLDVGCGSGLFFSHVAGKARLVVGVDVSRELLLKAKEQANQFQNVSVVQADADHLPFKNDFFEAVFSFTVLQNMPNPAKTLAELKRVAKSGGSVAVTGLKKFFPLHVFMDTLEGSGMKLESFFDEEKINCYIAVCLKLVYRKKSKNKQKAATTEQQETTT